MVLECCRGGASLATGLRVMECVLARVVFIIKRSFSTRLHRQRAHASLLADPPGSQVSGALLFSWNVIRTPPVGGEKCSCCDRFSGGAGVEGGGEVGAEVDGG
jgi:hypothetical protein